ncbi:MAG: TlpA family protein disulfide reductase [Thermoanaerobaculum sp.]|nr:TlpA family protein disulfide reductase [Thermoanaerobaculum sp.]
MVLPALLFAFPVVALQPLTPVELRQLIRSSQKPLVVNVWATWCRPCVEEFPELIAFARSHQDQVSVVLVSADFSNRRELVEQFLRQRGVDFLTYLKDGSDEEFIAVLSPLWSGVLPATFVFAAGGELVVFFDRKVSKKDLEEALMQARKKQSKKGGKR